MEIRELRAFIAVAEEGSLSGAARKLHLSQSALSQTVLTLERQLGVQLLLRGSTGVRLTEPGSVLLREGRALIAQHDRVFADVTGQAAADPGVLRVGVPLELPEDLLPPAFAQVTASLPGTRMEVSHASTAAQIAELRAGAVDLALLRECPPDPGFDAVLAVEEPLGVLLRAGKAAEIAGPAGVRLHDLTGLDWLSFPRAESPAWHDQITATLRAHGIEVNQVTEGSLIAEVKMAAVGSGRAFALAPPFWDRRQLPAGVAWQPLAGTPLVRRTWAVWLADSRRRDLAALVAALDASLTGLSINGRIIGSWPQRLARYPT